MLDRGGAQPDETFFDFVYQPLTEDGRVTGIAAVCFEVTELAKARRAAELANRAKDEFLAMLGHELRNPLAPILTALQLMNLRGVTGADRERQIIERQVKHVVRLVDDLLDVSRITRGKVQLRNERLRLPEVDHEGHRDRESRRSRSGRHTLQVDLCRRAGGRRRCGAARPGVRESAEQRREVHAIRRARIRVRTERVGDTVQVHVADTGRGIALEMLPRVFDLFVQERQDLESRARRPRNRTGDRPKSRGGTRRRGARRERGKGAGCDVHGHAPPGGVGGAGSVGRFRRPPRSSTTPGSRILLVDDNQDAATVLADSLRALGHDVLVAHDGPTALVAVERMPPAGSTSRSRAAGDGWLRARRTAARRVRVERSHAHRHYRVRAGSRSAANGCVRICTPPGETYRRASARHVHPGDPRECHVDPGGHRLT